MTTTSMNNYYDENTHMEKQPYDRAVSRNLCRIINFFPITKFFKLLIDETTIETHNLPAKFLFYVFFLLINNYFYMECVWIQQFL